MFSLQSKSTLITGAASGIGAAIARAFASRGAFVFVADLDEGGGAKIVAEIIAANGQAQFIPLDVTSEDDCARAMQTVQSTRGALDVLVNNAGIGFVGTLLQTTGEDLDKMYAVNVRGVFNMCKTFAPGMIENGGGAIVNLASIGGVVGIRDRLAYCATKYAVVGLTKCMALDHALQNLRVNCICPGRVETPFVQARLAEYSDPGAARREMESSQAVNRMAQPEEIAAAAVYLASDEAKFVTGSEFIIDGGFSAGK
jgi:NAD(P)-dependent dehydrogenase (short-subunit alcohol dehydrogenase family)